MPEHHNRGGETPGAREAMDRMVKQMVNAGQDPAYARKVVQRAALRAELDPKDR